MNSSDAANAGIGAVAFSAAGAPEMLSTPIPCNASGVTIGGSAFPTEGTTDVCSLDVRQ